MMNPPNQPTASISCHSRIDIRYLAAIAIVYTSTNRPIRSRSALIGSAIKDYGSLLIDAGKISHLPTYEESVSFLRSIGIDAMEEWNRSKRELIKKMQDESVSSEREDIRVSDKEFDKTHKKLWDKKGGEESGTKSV